MISMRKFSKLVGVSPATVSRAFSNSKGLSGDTRKRILEMAEHMDFRPSAVGSVVFGGGTKSIGVILPGFHVSYFMDIATGIQQSLFGDNYLPIILDSTVTKLTDCLDRLLDHRVDAVILNIANESLTRKDFAKLLKLNIPITLVGPVLAGLNSDTIDTNDLLGGQLAAEHLLSLGHTNFACTHYGAGASSCENRIKGFRDVLEKAGLALDTGKIADLKPFAKDNEAKFYLSIKRILSAQDRPTAFFATTDFHALEIYKAANELGLRIPEDLSVVGFADLTFSSYLHPALTTIRQNGIEVGRKATKYVLDRMNDGKNNEPRHLMVPVELITRESTASLIS